MRILYTVVCKPFHTSLLNQNQPSVSKLLTNKIANDDQIMLWLQQKAQMAQECNECRSATTITHS